jgi:hypothetical protein
VDQPGSDDRDSGYLVGRDLTSDVYEFAPGGFFVVHSAYGKIGDTSAGGVEIIGVDGDAYRLTFYDSFGNVHSC